MRIASATLLLTVSPNLDQTICDKGVGVNSVFFGAVGEKGNSAADFPYNRINLTAYSTRLVRLSETTAQEIQGPQPPTLKGLWDCKVTPAYCVCQGRNTICCILNNDGPGAGVWEFFPQGEIHRGFINLRGQIERSPTSEITTYGAGLVKAVISLKRSSLSASWPACSGRSLNWDRRHGRIQLLVEFGGLLRQQCWVPEKDHFAAEHEKAKATL